MLYGDDSSKTSQPIGDYYSANTRLLPRVYYQDSATRILLSGLCCKEYVGTSLLHGVCCHEKAYVATSLGRSKHWIDEETCTLRHRDVECKFYSGKGKTTEALSEDYKKDCTKQDLTLRRQQYILLERTRPMRVHAR
jgi:hypothetical protein